MSGGHEKRGVVIKDVVHGSPADALNLASGDRIVALDSNPVHDCLSWQFYSGQDAVRLDVVKADGSTWILDVDMDPDEPFGVTLEDDPIRRCRNKCVFCFVDQNPKCVRPSLMVKDEDIRLSFLYGNYTTLSSTDAAEETRIIGERLSPIYVSVHTTDPDIRVRLLGNKRAGNILERLTRLAEHGIDLHTQIVVCPGINDGLVLRKTLDDLAGLFPRILSVALVPLGLTDHRKGLVRLNPVTDDYCRRLVTDVQLVQEQLRRRFGSPLVYVSDEFYLRAGTKLPDAGHYADFPQLENGVGMVRQFLDDFDRAFDVAKLTSQCRATVVTGRLFYPVLRPMMDAVNRRFDADIRIVPVANRFFGEKSINVTGLLTASDVTYALKNRELHPPILLPECMLNDERPRRFLDDRTVAELERELGAEIILCAPEAAAIFQVLA